MIIKFIRFVSGLVTTGCIYKWNKVKQNKRQVDVAHFVVLKTVVNYVSKVSSKTGIHQSIPKIGEQ